MYERLVKRRVMESLLDTPAVLIVGPRRAGKTTLVQQMVTEDRRYFTLDDQSTLNAAKSDPVGFIRGLNFAIIDEIQRVPELLLAIKKSIDDDKRPGRFLLTGSANLLSLPRIADSLAGRMEIIQLLPLSRVEISGKAPTFLECIFDGTFKVQDVIVGDELINMALTGGFPEAMARENERRRQDWFRSYLSSVLTRNLRDVAEIERLTELPRLVRFLAQHSGQLINNSEFGKSIGVNYKTTQRYLGLLEQVFLISVLPPWYTNAIKRMVKTAKLHFLDSGLLAASRGLTFSHLQANRAEFGALLESFVFAEILRLLTGSNLRLELYHFRDQQSREVDLVLERDDSMVAGIEVKASATICSRDFAGLKTLADACKNRFSFGAVLYDGASLIPFGEKMAAVPISCLWT
jgi:uncharacterized protein